MPNSSFGKKIFDRALALEAARITERAAISAAHWRGKGDEMRADQAAVAAMHETLAHLDMAGRIVLGEPLGSPYLEIGELIGSQDGLEVDIAIDPLEGTTGCAKNLPDSLSVLAITSRDGFLPVPDVYMEKIAIASDYPAGLVSLERSASENIIALAKAKGVPPSEITACVLDRSRHTSLIAELRTLGVSVKLLSDGDIAGIIHAADTENTGIDIYLGSGGAQEGVLAAAAIRCLGGQMQGKLILDTEEKRKLAQARGITNFTRIYDASELAGGDVLFAATGVTDGSLLSGVQILPKKIVTSTVVMRSWSHTVRWIKTEHQR